MKLFNTFIFIFFFCAISIASCAEKDTPVYLSVNSVEVSSFDVTADWAPPPDVMAVTDGSLLTRWSSNYTDNQWIVLDFGRPRVLSKVVIFWEAAYAVDYDILVSEDNQNWRRVSSLEKQDGGLDEIVFAPVKARAVKLAGKKRFNPDWGISAWELLCFGPGSKNPGDKTLSVVYPRLADKLLEKDFKQVELKIEEPQVSPGAVKLNEMQKGVVYTSWGRTELGTEASDKTLERLKKVGVSHLGIMIVWYQDTVEEDVIGPDAKDTPDDKALIHAINRAHSLGMKVMLKPHVDIRTDEWRGYIIPSNDWFTSYKNYLMYYVRLAEQYNVEVFSIGTELVNVTLPNWQSQWDSIIRDIRKAYSGRIVYSANWDEYKSVPFWNKMDFIGIDAYFPLTAKKDPTKKELIAGWQAHAAEIDEWLKAEKLKKPVVFNEIGYCSADGTNIQPWMVFADIPGAVIDQEEQADCMDAMLAVCSAYPWFKGFYWWNYFPTVRYSPLGYTIQNKRAEEIFINWLRKI